jgi:lipoyl(octanoyl) transferase
MITKHQALLCFNWTDGQIGSTGETMTLTLPFQIQDFGLTNYETIWALQKDLVQQRLTREIPDTLLIGEHPPVITLGRGGHAENLLTPDIPVISIERGGDVTYHGPGQLIAYPILLLPEGQRDLHLYLRHLEESLIRTLEHFGLEGMRNPGWTGVWVQSPKDGRLLKIASIGVAVKKWVTYHGIALNVNTDLLHFQQINPCGLESQVMTSLEQLLARNIPMSEVKQAFINSFRQIFYPC